MRSLLFIATVFTTITATSQSNTPQYTSAIGAKISSGVAFSYKQFVTQTNAVEGQVMYFKEGIRFIGLYEFHFYNIEGLNGLAWYAGGGVHTGFWFPKFKEKYNGPVDLGIDGVVGLDYKIPTIPINISLDWQPSFGLIGNAGIMPQFGGLGVRYIIN